MDSYNDDGDNRVILYPAGGRFNRLRRKQHFLNDLLHSSFEGWEHAQNKKEFVCTNILSKIPGGIWIFDREREIPVRTDQKDVENRILQKMRDMKKSIRGRGVKEGGDAPNGPKATTPPRRRKRREYDESSSDESIPYSPRKRLSRRQKDMVEKRAWDEEERDDEPTDFEEEEPSEVYEEEEEDTMSPPVNVHMEAAEIVERALHGTASEDDDLPTPIFIDHLYESNYIPATADPFYTTTTTTMTLDA